MKKLAKDSKSKYGFDKTISSISLLVSILALAISWKALRNPYDLIELQEKRAACDRLHSSIVNHYSKLEFISKLIESSRLGHSDREIVEALKLLGAKSEDELLRSSLVNLVKLPKVYTTMVTEITSEMSTLTAALNAEANSEKFSNSQRNRLVTDQFEVVLGKVIHFATLCGSEQILLGAAP